MGRDRVLVHAVRNIKMSRLQSLPTWEPRLLTRELTPVHEDQSAVKLLEFPGPITFLVLHKDCPFHRDPCCCVTLWEVMKFAVD